MTTQGIIARAYELGRIYESHKDEQPEEQYNGLCDYIAEELARLEADS